MEEVSRFYESCPLYSCKVDADSPQLLQNARKPCHGDHLFAL